MKTNTASDDRLLMTLPEAARRLGVCVPTVRRYFPLVRIGGSVRVRIADINAKITSKGT